MKLYNSALSPFASRARLSIYHKGLAVEIVAPPASGIKGPEYLALNPMGKIPVLVLADGTCIPESETIVEYFEDKFPEKPLRPATAEALARARLIARVGDLYIQPNIFPLFGQMNPATRDQAVTDKHMDGIKTGLQHLNHFLADGGPWCLGKDFTIADVSVVPVLYFVDLMVKSFGVPLFDAAPRVAGLWATAQKDALTAKVLAEMAEGLVAFRKRMAG